MLNYIYRIFFIGIRNIFVLAFYIFVGFFILPIIFYIVFIYLSNLFIGRFKLLLSIFIIMNIAIAVFISVSTYLWVNGSIADISFTYVLYNIARTEILYLIPIWVIAITFEIMQLLRIREIWSERSAFFDITN